MSAPFRCTCGCGRAPNVRCLTCGRVSGSPKCGCCEAPRLAGFSPPRSMAVSTAKPGRAAWAMLHGCRVRWVAPPGVRIVWARRGRR